MPVQKNCEYCKKVYYVPLARDKKTRFCSMTCRSANDRTAERRELVCEACESKFTTVADHGVWPKFCSRKCFLSECVRPEKKPCATCGEVFNAAKAHHNSVDGLRKYCSDKCRFDGLKRGSEYFCLNCSKPFWLPPSTMAKKGDAGCCSQDCRTEFYRGDRSHAFKCGFYIHSQMNEKHILFMRDGYVGKYAGEHRIVAGSVIGRELKRGEFVIRINRNPKDNRPENLFICASNSEFSMRRSGSLPWPNNSNLHGYEICVTDA